MWKLWNTAAPVWAPADEGTPGDTGGLAPTGDDPGQGANPPAPVDAGGEGELGAPAAGKPSSIMDFAKRGEGEKPAEGGEKWKLPDGLEIADHLVGDSAEDTLRKMSVAYAGARKELSTRSKDAGVLEGTVPKDIDGYQITLDEKAKDNPALADLTSEASKPIVDAWRAAALEVGIPNEAFSKFMQQGVAKMAEGGLTIGNAQEQTELNGAAEYEALTKQLGKDGADMALHQLDTFGLKLQEHGILNSEEDLIEYAQMFGTARGAVIGQRMISVMFGEKAIPRGDGPDGEQTVAEARATLDAALKMPAGSDREAAVLRAEEGMKKAIRPGINPGQMKSSVL